MTFVNYYDGILEIRLNLIFSITFKKVIIGNENYVCLACHSLLLIVRTKRLRFPQLPKFFNV